MESPSRVNIGYLYAMEQGATLSLNQTTITYQTNIGGYRDFKVYLKI